MKKLLFHLHLFKVLSFPNLQTLKTDYLKKYFHTVQVGFWNWLSYFWLSQGSSFYLVKFCSDRWSYPFQKKINNWIKTAKNLSRQFRFDNHRASVCIIKLSKTSSLSLHSCLNKVLCKACLFILLTAFITKFNESF